MTNTGIIHVPSGRGTPARKRDRKAPRPKNKPVPDLTVAQLSAVDLLASGQNDTETATALGVNRVTVTRWRLYSPEFRAALADRRAVVWSASADRLRALLPKALDVLADALERADDKVSVALSVLKLAAPLPLVPSDPTDSGEYVRRVVEVERRRARNLDHAADDMCGLPEFEEHEQIVRARLERLADGAKDGAPRS